ncbi:MAG: hypothetical protein QW267_07280 [Sulfolobales archaeon]
MNDFNAFTAMMYGQLKRWWNARSRVVMTLLYPLVWMVFLGLGWGSIFSPRASPTYKGYQVYQGLSRYLGKLLTTTLNSLNSYSAE